MRATAAVQMLWLQQQQLMNWTEQIGDSCVSKQCSTIHIARHFQKSNRRQTSMNINSSPTGCVASPIHSRHSSPPVEQVQRNQYSSITAGTTTKSVEIFNRFYTLEKTLTSRLNAIETNASGYSLCVVWRSANNVLSGPQISKELKPECDILHLVLCK